MRQLIDDPQRQLAVNVETCDGEAIFTIRARWNLAQIDLAADSLAAFAPALWDRIADTPAPEPLERRRTVPADVLAFERKP